MEELLAYLPLFDVDFSKVPVCQSQNETQSEGLKVPKSKYSGVIVESREHPMLELVLKNFVYMLPDWSLTIFHCQKNKEFIEGILGPKSSVKLVELLSPDLDIQGYNELLTSEWFYQQIEAEKILIFQCDSFIRKSNIADFLQYDYVGAPWRGIRLNVSGKEYTTQVGNGGLSLRDKETMLTILKHQELQPYLGKINEDTFFSIGVLLVPCNRCSPEIASSFSAETFFHPNPFGWHKGYFLPGWNILKSVVLDFRAYYGLDDNYVDVTQLLLARESNGIIDLRAPYNELFGDPEPLRTKYLRIESKIVIHLREDTPVRIARRILPPKITQLKGSDKLGYFLLSLFPDLEYLTYGQNFYKRIVGSSLIDGSQGLELVLDR